MPVEDSYIAATARRHGLTIATGHDRDFRRPGLVLQNRTFRRQDYATDVLSFPANPQGGLPDGYLGDLAISWQRAREQASEFGHSMETEIRVLMLHGVLHLAGMDHETDGDSFRTRDQAGKRPDARDAGGGGAHGHRGG
jgi:rRNA maturation RNase YbeY